MASPAPSSVCLDVAIDHRIRRLLNPRHSIKVNAPVGNHVDKLRKLYPYVRERSGNISPEPEFQVTEQLAKPLTQGGLLIALERPANDHPFADGVDAVIDKSPTLRALKDAFSLIGLDLVKDVTIIDSLPFIPKQDKLNFANNQTAYQDVLQKHREVFLEAVIAKRPNVVLCMWRREDELQGHCDVPAWDIRSKGVGKLFDSENVTLQDRHGNWIKTQRVNVFHPGYCMNHNPEYSQFRQLLMLEVAHAWHLMGPGWVEEKWMKELRRNCEEKAKRLLGSNGRKAEILHFEYEKAVSKIQLLIPELKSGKWEWSHDETSKTLYKKLVAAKWTESLNDAALCLKAAQNPQRDLIRVYDTTGLQGDIAIQTMEVAISLAMELEGSERIELRNGPGIGLFSDNFIRCLRGNRQNVPSAWFKNARLKRGLVRFLQDLNNAFSDTDVQGPIPLQMSLVSASKAFLTMSSEMEELLGTLDARFRALELAKAEERREATEAASEVSEDSASELVGGLGELAI